MLGALLAGGSLGRHVVSTGGASEAPFTFDESREAAKQSYGVQTLAYSAGAMDEK